MATDIVLRVGVYNNFNFTEEENKEVRLRQEEGYKPFVNSNSFVKIKNDFPSIITVNPYLIHFIAPRGDVSNVKACRLKVYLGATNAVNEEFLKAINWCKNKNIPILITFMRFRSKDSLKKYVCKSSYKDYSFKKGYYRLTDEAKNTIIRDLRSWTTIPEDLLHFCDLAEEGCPSCGNCAKLTYNTVSEIASLSLSCSGDKGSCIFDCPDCWAKVIGKVFKFTYDKVTRNSKQKGVKTL